MRNMNKERKKSEIVGPNVSMGDNAVIFGKSE